jgi:hypothetical protein
MRYCLEHYALHVLLMTHHFSPYKRAAQMGDTPAGVSGWYLDMTSLWASRLMSDAECLQ